MAYQKLDIKTGLSIIMEGFDVDTTYINEFPYNCGYCHDNGTISGDCWCMFPKSLIWSWACGIRLFKNRKKGTYFYNGQNGSYNGIGKSGLGDWTGDEIIKHCTNVDYSTFKNIKPLEVMLIPGHHMAMYVGEFKKNGKTYNSVEFNYFDESANGLIPFWVTNAGNRYWCKGGSKMGGKFACHGQLSTWIDYSGAAPAPEPEKKLTPDQLLDLCKDVNAGKWGNNPERKTKLIKAYGKTVYNKVQYIINMLYS